VKALVLDNRVVVKWWLAAVETGLH
jgi:hypothetical protein